MIDRRTRFGAAMVGLWTGLALIGCAPRGLVFDEDRPLVHRGVQLEFDRVSSQPFDHFIVRRAACQLASGAPQIVFLDGDGHAWIHEGRVSMDPTPDHSVALDLLITEPTCAIYLSRPCVHGLIESDTECNPLVWTRDRYSPEVIDSLAGVLETAPYRDADVLLVGHSGGGQLASRLASRIPRTQGLITLGANLDLAAWVAHHGYDVDLTLGKKPFPLRPEIVQLHVLADGDRVVPNTQVIDFLEENAPQSKQFTIEGADHSCCWADNWTGIKAEWRAASGR